VKQGFKKKAIFALYRIVCAFFMLTPSQLVN